MPFSSAPDGPSLPSFGTRLLALLLPRRVKRLLVFLFLPFLLFVFAILLLIRLLSFFGGHTSLTRLLVRGAGIFVDIVCIILVILGLVWAQLHVFGTVALATFGGTLVATEALVGRSYGRYGWSELVSHWFEEGRRQAYLGLSKTRRVV
jgi:hypothetical protein